VIDSWGHGNARTDLQLTSCNYYTSSIFIVIMGKQNRRMNRIESNRARTAIEGTRSIKTRLPLLGQVNQSQLIVSLLGRLPKRHCLLLRLAILLLERRSLTERCLLLLRRVLSGLLLRDSRRRRRLPVLRLSAVWLLLLHRLWRLSEWLLDTHTVSRLLHGRLLLLHPCHPVLAGVLAVLIR